MASGILGVRRPAASWPGRPWEGRGGPRCFLLGVDSERELPAGGEGCQDVPAAAAAPDFPAGGSDAGNWGSGSSRPPPAPGFFAGGPGTGLWERPQGPRCFLAERDPQRELRRGLGRLVFRLACTSRWRSPSGNGRVLGRPGLPRPQPAHQLGGSAHVAGPAPECQFRRRAELVPAGTRGGGSPRFRSWPLPEVLRTRKVRRPRARGRRSRGGGGAVGAGALGSVSISARPRHLMGPQLEPLAARGPRQTCRGVDSRGPLSGASA